GAELSCRHCDVSPLRCLLMCSKSVRSFSIVRRAAVPAQAGRDPPVGLRPRLLCPGRRLCQNADSAIPPGIGGRVPHWQDSKMTPASRRAWRVVASVARVNLIVVGPSIRPIGIFFPPLIKELGWTRQQVSWMATAFLVAMGVINPVAGWLLDRIPARIPVSIG